MKAFQLTIPFLAAIVLGIIAVCSIWAQEPWLAPSVGSAIFTQTFNPDQPSAKPFSVGVGQLLGAAAGFVAVLVAGAGATPLFTGGHELLYPRVIAVIIATFLAAALQLLCRAKTPAGGATAIVVALGIEATDWNGALHLVVGILLITALGEAARQVVLRLR